MRFSELIDLLPVSESTIRRLVKSGELPTIRIGRQIFVSRDQMEKWLVNGGTAAGSRQLVLPPRRMRDWAVHSIVELWDFGLRESATTDKNGSAMKCSKHSHDEETSAGMQGARETFEGTSVLTIADAAKELRCSKAHLAKVLNDQVPGLPHLPHLRLGRRKLIRRSVLYQWMAEVERSQSGMLSESPEVRAV